jgi:predicted DNA-binding protein
VQSDDVFINFSIPRELSDRTKKLAKQLKKTCAGITRDALREKIEDIEHKFRQEEALRQHEKEARKAARQGAPRRNIADKPRGLSILSDEIPLVTQARRGSVSPTDPFVDPTEKLYIDQAKFIAEAGNDKVKLRVRAIDAIATIKRERPLTSPPDEQIIAKLERYLLVIKQEEAEAPPPPTTHTIDDLVGRVIDTTKIKTANASDKSDV